MILSNTWYPLILQGEAFWHLVDFVDATLPAAAVVGEWHAGPGLGFRGLWKEKPSWALFFATTHNWEDNWRKKNVKWGEGHSGGQGLFIFVLIRWGAPTVVFCSLYLKHYMGRRSIDGWSSIFLEHWALSQNRSIDMKPPFLHTLYKWKLNCSQTIWDKLYYWECPRGTIRESDGNRLGTLWEQRRKKTKNSPQHLPRLLVGCMKFVFWKLFLQPQLIPHYGQVTKV